MFNRFSISIIFLTLAQLIAPIPAGAEDISIERLRVLLGEWRGVGDGKWGKSSAERTYSFVFDGIYVRGHGRSVYPRQDKNPSGEIHETVDMFSFDRNRNTIVLRQFDNEAFVTTYYLIPATLSPNKMEFMSEHLENVPVGWRARVLFDFKGEDEFHEYFELDTNKGSFERYLTTRFLRISMSDNK